MPLLIGQALTGRDVEKETSGWPPERFASMCDALAWAASGRKVHELPSFTSRVYDPDGGVDSQWDITVPEEVSSMPTPIIGPGWNVFQYKKRDLIARGRSQIVSGLSSVLTGAIKEVYEHFGRTPDRYVLFANVDLKADQKEKLRKAILKDSHQDQHTHIEIIGAADLAALLNNHPHLRASFFMPLPFKTWQEAYKAHESHKVLGAAVELTGREEEKAKLQSLIQDKEVRIVVLTGPHDIGKTRLGLEATRDRPHDVVVALDPRSMGISDYLNLSSPHGEAICIVEDPDPASLDRLLAETLGISNLKLIATLPSPSLAPGLSYGLDKRIEVMAIEPLDEKASFDLLRATGQRFEFSIAEWIIRQAKGFPGILLAAASVGTDLRRDPGDFLVKVGRELEKRIRSELGGDVLKAAEIFSILTHVGISGDWANEIKRLCDLFGDGLQPREAIRGLEMLEEAGLAKRAGSFGEITLAILGNYLAGNALVAGRDKMFALYGYLNDSGRERFISRLSEIKGAEVEMFWDAFFSREGPFRGFSAAIQRPRLLPFVAGAVPLRLLGLFESGLLPLNREERLSLKGEERRQLMWALEQLLFREATSRGALKLLWLLAEAENEAYGNNASGVLKECLHPMHKQMPLPLDERLDAIREFTSENASREGRIVAIVAAGEALRRGFHSIRQSVGLKPLDRRPPFTYEGLAKYVRDLIDLLIGIANDKDEEVARTALRVLPGLISEYGVMGRATDAIAKLRTLVDWAAKDKPGLEVSRLVDVIRHLVNTLSHRIETGKQTHEAAEEMNTAIQSLKEVKSSLEKGSFDVRLKRWAGAWSIEDGEKIQVDSRDVPRYEYEVEIERLAEEAAENPALLTDQLMSWLLSASAQKSHLVFYFLGKHDRSGAFREAIDRVGRAANGSDAFAAYFEGWASRDPEGSDSRIEALSSSGDYPAEPILRATSRINATQTAVKRVIRLIEEGRISGFDAGRFLAGRWPKELDLNALRDLLEAVAGADHRGASGVLLMLSEYGTENWTQDDKVTEIAWRCLEAAPETRPYLTKWDLDSLAAQLARMDARRGITLLESLLKKERAGDFWDPLEMHPKHRFWDVLHEQDKDSLFKMLFDAGLGDFLVQYHVTSSLKELLDQEKDADLLIFWARRDERIAEMIAHSLSFSKQGFRPILEQLISLYPKNEKIERYLLGAIQLENEGGFGLPSEALKGSRELVEAWINDPKTSAEVRAFLRKAIERLQGIISHEVVWEYDIDIAGIRRKIEDKTSPDRIWAIGRVLKYGGPDDWMKLLNVGDIEDALPQIDLPEKKRAILERALPYWRNHV